MRAVKQQKCLSHILRSVREVLRQKKGPARDFRHLKTRLLDAIELRGGPGRWGAGLCGTSVAAVGARSPISLRPRLLPEPDNQRLLNVLGRIMTGATCCASWRTHRRADEQPGRAGPASRRDRSQGVAVLEERRRSTRLCGLHQCGTDAGKAGGCLHGGGIVPNLSVCADSHCSSSDSS